MSQSELEAAACNLRQARENACQQGVIGFGGHLSRKVARGLPINHKVTQCNPNAKED